jgi:hypothetical protein
VCHSVPRLETSSVRDIGLSDDCRCLVELLARGTAIFDFILCRSIVTSVGGASSGLEVRLASASFR